MSSSYGSRLRTLTLTATSAMLVGWLSGCAMGQDQYYRAFRAGGEKPRNTQWLYPARLLTDSASQGWGYIDGAGKTMIPPVFSQAEEFSDDAARVFYDSDEVDVGPDGVVGRLPANVAAERRNRAGRYLTSSQKTCLIDPRGKAVTPPVPSLETDYPFWSSDTVLVRQDSGTFLWFSTAFGYMDRSGRWITKPVYPEAYPPSDGLARVRISGINKGRAHIWFAGPYGYIDTRGKPAIPARFEDAQDFSEGLAAVRIGGKWGYINKPGELAVRPQFSDAGPFSEGLARVSVLTGGRDRWGKPEKAVGYIDRTGRYVIQPRAPWYLLVCNFHDGLAVAVEESSSAADSKHRFGFIDKTGKTAIAGQFEWASDFSEGLAAVRCDGGSGGWGYIDRTGAVVVPPQFTFAHEFHGGVARVDWKGRWGYINKTGKVIWQSTVP